MPIGRVDFVNIPSYEPVTPGDYDGFTKTWEEKPTKNGDSTNIEATFTFEFNNSDGEPESRSIIARWNMKPGALWNLRNSLVNMGIDPSEFSETTDVEAMLNQVFGSVPTPVTLTLTKDEFPQGSGQYRNNVKAVKARSV